jgi:hypothetical protein
VPVERYAVTLSQSSGAKGGRNGRDQLAFRIADSDRLKHLLKCL